MDATTTICHRHTPQSLLSSLTKTADILISAAGKKLDLEILFNFYQGESNGVFFPPRCSWPDHC